MGHTCLGLTFVRHGHAKRLYISISNLHRNAPTTYRTPLQKIWAILSMLRLAFCLVSWNPLSIGLRRREWSAPEQIQRRALTLSIDQFEKCSYDLWNMHFFGGCKFINVKINHKPGIQGWELVFSTLVHKFRRVRSKLRTTGLSKICSSESINVNDSGWSSH